MVITVKRLAAGSKAGESSQACPVPVSHGSQCLWEGASQPLPVCKRKQNPTMEQRLGNVRASGARMESSYSSMEAARSSGEALVSTLPVVSEVLPQPQWITCIPGKDSCPYSMSLKFYRS